MGKINLDLNQFKASGIYTVEYDASERQTITTETTRLVIGFSKKGPINAPVFLRDLKTARKVYGPIDRQLEKRGSFFHRSIETCLSEGPIFALNLMPLNNAPLTQGGDAADYKSFSLNITEENGIVSRDLYSSFYNKEGFWKADTEYFDAIVNNNYSNKGRLFNIANLGQTPLSIIVRKSTGILGASGYNLTARDYFGSGNVPEYIRDFDYVSDYFVEVIAVEGDWTDYNKFSTDPVFSKYFDKRGLKISELDKFLSIPEVRTVANIVGTIIPDFIDNNGSNQFIETLVNNSTATTGLFMTVNKDALEDYSTSIFTVDMVGHSLVGTSDDTIDFLSYNTPIKQELGYIAVPALAEVNNPLVQYNANTAAASNLDADFAAYAQNYVFDANYYNATTALKTYVTSKPLAGNSGYFNNILVIEKPALNASSFTISRYQEILNSIKDISLIKSDGAVREFGFDYVKVENVVDAGDKIQIQISHPYLSNPEFVTTLVNRVQTVAQLPLSAATDPYTVLVLIPGTLNNMAIAPVAGDIVYLEVNGIKQYVQIDTVTNGGGITNDEISIKQAPDDYANGIYYSKFCGVDFNTIKTALDNYLFYAYDIKLRFYSTSFVSTLTTDDILQAGITYQNLIPHTDTTVSPVTFVYEPAAFFVRKDGALYDSYEIYPGHKMAKDIASGKLNDKDKLYFNTSDYYYIDVDDTWGLDYDATSNIKYGLKGARVRMYTDESLLSKVTAVSGLVNPFVNIGAIAGVAGAAAATSYTSDGIPYSGGVIFYSSAIKDLVSTVEIVDGSMISNKTKFRIPASESAKLEVGYYLENGDITNPGLVRVVSKIRRLNPTTGEIEYEINTTTGIKDYLAGVPFPSGNTMYVKGYMPIHTYADRLQFTALNGFTISDYHLPSSASQLWKILGLLESTKIGSTLANDDIITYRYIVDTFGYGIEPMLGAKSILARLAKQRQKCLAFINAPSFKDLAAHTDPRFTNEPDILNGDPKPLINTEYIALGGNLTLGPSYLMTLPDEENGAKHIGVFTPWLKYKDNNKTIFVPPAADVSNNFIRKFNTGNPYSIVAGTRRGVLSNQYLTGLEYDLVDSDREFLEPVGFNPIINKRNVGIMIYGNQSAFQKYISAYNNLHVRDLLITIESAIEEILERYVFEFNDSSTRLEVKSIVESYLEKVRTAGGVYDYIVIMDDTNNTPEIIDQNFGVIDVALEPVRGMQKIINRVTITKTGAIASGGFSIA